MIAEKAVEDRTREAFMRMSLSGWKSPSQAADGGAEGIAAALRE